jgi:hypothetical protein
MPIIATNQQPARTLLGVVDSDEQCCTTPTAPYSTAAVSCNGQNILSAPVATTNGTPILSRMKVISVKGGQKARIRWQMHDQLGNPVNLTECIDYCSSSSSASSESLSVTITFKCREYLLINALSLPTFERTATIIDAETGIVEVELTGDDTQHPGIYFAEMCVDISCDDTVGVYFSNIFYLAITTSLSFSNRSYAAGPPTIAEIRLHLRDSSADESYLMDNLAFDDAEIALAIIRPVQQFNETPPELDPRFTTSDFPYRYYWLEGICAQLFTMAAEFYRRNNLSYSAGGIQVDDMNKAKDYMQIADYKRQIWTEFIKRKKIEMNLANCFGNMDSPYSGYGY